jgi:hypothetical protein
MNEQYTVIRNFQDKYTNQNYSVGQNFNADDQQRAQELEGGGYIAPTNSTMAKDAMAQAENAQANAQALANAHTKAANKAEPKTVLGGKVVPLKVAQAAESAFDESNRTTGIQKHHDNTTEAVPAGQIASRSQSTAESASAQMYNQLQEQEQQAQQNQTIKAANVQSGQAGMQEHLQQAEQEVKQAQQQLEQQMQQAQGQQAQGQQNSQQQQQAERQALAAAAEKTNPMAAEHETAAEMQQAAAKATAKARAKKE